VPASGYSLSTRITLARALVALGVLLVAINIGSAVWDVRNDRSRTEQRAQRDFRNVTSLLSEQTASSLEAVDLVLRDAARGGSAMNVAALVPRLKEALVHVPQVAAFLVLDAEGRVIARTNETPTLDRLMADRPYFIAHRSGVQGTFLSPPYIGGGEQNRWRFVMSRRLQFPGGGFSGVIAAVMEIENFDHLYRMIDVGVGSFINLRAADGTIVTRVPDPRGARGKKFPNAAISRTVEREGRFSGWTTSPILNERVLLSAVAVRGFPLEVLAGATEESVFAPWRREAASIAVRTLLTSAAMMILIALAAWGLARHERALQRSERRFRAMIERSSDVELLHDPVTGTIVYASPSLERVLGYRPDELVGKRSSHLLHPDHVDEQRRLSADLNQEPGKVLTTEVMLRHKDGSWRWVENTLTNMLNEPSVNAVVMNVRDITERKLAESERAHLGTRLRQAEKMEAVGRLAGGIAHDFNNILGGILGYAEMLAEETPAESRLKRYANNVLAAANRARGLVDQILAYSRRQRAERKALDLGRIVAEALELVRGSLAPGLRLETELPAKALQVIGDATQLHQVVMNLCTNAVQAMGAQGMLRVSLEATEVPAERALAHGTLSPGSYVRLCVEDSGAGMDEATLARIFEPFFTTKEAGKGTGLGLSLVYGIVTDSGGAIEVASTPGRGSAFDIYLPRVDTILESSDSREEPVARGHGERVLVVDDEEALLAVTSELLARLGYRPKTFSDARAALAEFESAPERFEAVVTDEVMPGMTGTEIAQRRRDSRPDLPILLVSGYIGPMMSERAALAGVAEILKKPVHSRELAAALARALHKTPSFHP
jgi:PAS domain S-box-containing protein